MISRIGLVVGLLTGTLAVVWASPVCGDDWPQWMGPQRDNVWRESGIISKFPAGGPKVLWRSPVNVGYAGPAIAQGRVFVADFVSADDVKVANFERKEFVGSERLLCLDEATGKVLWQREYPVTYSISYPSGPRCTPVVADGLVYLLGAEGNLRCWNATDGKEIWGVNLKEKYQTTSALWGYSAHPLIDGDQLITLAGGNGSHVVALNKKTGAELWRSTTSKEQGYAPPTIITAGGKRQLILARPDAVSAVDPANGQEYWSVPYEATSGSIIMSPLHIENYLYVAGYSRKSLLLELDGSQPQVKEVWRDRGRDAISPVNVQPLAVDKLVFGCDESGDLCCLEIPSGNRLWATPQPIGQRRVGSGTAFIVRQDDRYWMFTETGHLVLATMDRDGFKELDRAKLLEPTNNAFGRSVVWSMPAFANRRMYVRNDQEIICVELGEGK